MDSLPLDRILKGDCLEILPTLPPRSVDLVFADPPYNLQLKQELWRPDQTRVDAVDEDWDRFAGFGEYDLFTRRWLSECKRVLKPGGTLWVIGTYHNIFRVGVVLQDLGYWILNTVTWIKNNPMPNFRGVRFTNAHETLIWAQPERGTPYTFNHHAMKSSNGDLQMRSDWYLPICTGKERLRVDGHKAHPTQKPEALLYRVIQASSNPGDVVLDPFFGTGTSGVVARRLHRHWIGIEQDASYVALAEKRIESEERRPYDAEVYITPEPRRQPRVPFGRLVEAGLLAPGELLYLGEDGEVSAVILADGALKYNGRRASIHQIARQVRGKSCNGWHEWYYRDPESGELRKIDHLRRILREQFNQ